MKFEGHDIAEMSREPLKRLAQIFRPWADGTARGWKALEKEHPEKAMVAAGSRSDLVARLEVLHGSGAGLSLAGAQHADAVAPASSSGSASAPRCTSNLFGVVYVLDEPSAGLHPADTEALLRALDRLKAAGNSMFVVEHELDVMRHADWIVDVGPDAGEHGGRGAVQRAAAGAGRGQGVADAARTCSATRRRPRGSRESRRAGSGSRV